MTGDHHHTEITVRQPVESSVDTKSKLLVTLVFVLTTIIAISYDQLAILGFFCLVLFFLYRVKIKPLLLKTLVPLPLIVSLSILAYISYPKEGFQSFGGVVIDYSRLELTMFFFARSVIIVLISLLLIESEPSFFEIIYALEELKIPDTIVNILLLMYRSTLDLQQEAKRMLDARYSRSANRRWGTNIYTYKVLGYMVGGILVRAFLRKDQRRDALYSRNFSGILYHKKKSFSFRGLLLLWISMFTALIILLNSSTNFIPIGELQK